MDSSALKIVATLLSGRRLKKKTFRRRQLKLHWRKPLSRTLPIETCLVNEDCEQISHQIIACSVWQADCSQYTAAYGIGRTILTQTSDEIEFIEAKR
jgi:hypothetical protein